MVRDTMARHEMPTFQAKDAVFFANVLASCSASGRWSLRLLGKQIGEDVNDAK